MLDNRRNAGASQRLHQRQRGLERRVPDLKALSFARGERRWGKTPWPIRVAERAPTVPRKSKRSARRGQHGRGEPPVVDFLDKEALRGGRGESRPRRPPPPPPPPPTSC